MQVSQLLQPDTLVPPMTFVMLNILADTLTAFEASEALKNALSDQ